MLFQGLTRKSSKIMRSMSLLRTQARFFGVGDMVSVRDALNQAHEEEMERDPTVTNINPLIIHITSLYNHFYNLIRLIKSLFIIL